MPAGSGDNSGAIRSIITCVWVFTQSSKPALKESGASQKTKLTADPEPARAAALAAEIVDRLGSYLEVGTQLGQR